MVMKSSRSTCGPRQKQTPWWEASDLEWTILRPGGFTDDPGTGNVRIEATPFSGPVPRDDVAGVLAALLADGESAGQVLYLSSGSTPINEALDDALR